MARKGIFHGLLISYDIIISSYEGFSNTVLAIAGYKQKQKVLSSSNCCLVSFCLPSHIFIILI